MLEKTKYFIFSFLIFFMGNTFLFSQDNSSLSMNADYIKKVRDNWGASERNTDNIEGIYIQYKNKNPYILMIKKDKDDYYGYYIKGPGGSGWKEGDLKVIFKSNKNGYDVTWYNNKNKADEKVTVDFNNSSFVLKFPVFLMTRLDEYRKIYPYALDFISENRITGTGFLLNKDGFVITNYHVIEDVNQIFVRGINGDTSKAYPYVPVLIDKENDIAILKPDVSFIKFSDPPYGFRNDNVAVGADVFALGYPLRIVMGDEIKLTPGIISSLSGFKGNQNAYQTTAPISPGNSGGPLFDMNGYVIGINSSYFPYGNNVYYAIKSRYILELINNSNLKINVSRRSLLDSLVNQNLVEKTKSVRNFVYMIEAY